MIEALLLAALGGALVGFLLATFGGGGSVLAMPWLVYVVGVGDTHIAIGTSAAAVALSAAAALAAQARAGTVKWPCASVFAAAGIAGALAGAHIAKQVDGTALLGFFALAMAAVAIGMALPRKNEGDPDVRIDGRLVAKLAPTGLVTGFAAGFFGIGGGFLIAPGLMAATGMTLANAAASSLLSVTIFGASTSASYAWSGLVDWPLFGALVAGGVAGTWPGVVAARYLTDRAPLARRLFALMILAVAASILVSVLW
ncbi:MAG: sulfite exporter TauE/SafE family protein [Parasphingopyxis sp.]|uniref:sulfite exporter TauE/SafE family protein n=1 Tax=Parasphingopyxis sp. TaxID=1920299 RepID=UPI0026397A59|nr:sulfite exporter TauE/SafE family protein [uncultured Parasphingopyxis sp.]